MKIKSPIVTLLVGVLIAVLILILSINSQGHSPAYGALAAVTR